MDLHSTSTLITLAGCLLSGLLLGYAIGSRRSRRSRRELQQSLNSQSLDLLDIKSEHGRMRKLLGQSQRKDRLLKLVLRRLQLADTQVSRMADSVQAQEHQHYIQRARLQMVAVTSQEKARRATRIAQRATRHLKRLELASPATQTITAPEPKSYGQGESVTVSVVDQQSPDNRHDAVSRVSNRDSARLTKLRPSNEGQCFNPDNLQAIRGISPDLERSLNQAGIHRVEQLANMSEAELGELSRAVGHSTNAHKLKADWVGGARELLEQQPG